MKKRLVIIFSVIFIVVCVIVLPKQTTVTPPLSNTISIEETEFEVEILDTEEKRIQGLSGREILADNTVMLFVFEKEDLHGIWMKDMKFPIDILWLDKNLEIVHVEKSISPKTFPKVFYSTKPSLYVIEANSNFVLENEIHIGDRVVFSK